MKKDTDNDEKDKIRLALGRIFRIMSRPFQKGDIEDYENCRYIILDSLKMQTKDYAPNYIRDRLKGAQGD